LGGFEFVTVILLVGIGVLYWKAIQQVLRFRKDRKWNGKFVISAAWLGLVSINVVVGLIRSIF
jgi:Co/Zn/Cd efflux system component